MKKLRILVSLTTNDNDYQIEQAQSAEQMARKLGVELQIVYADNDAITQSTQILKPFRPTRISARTPLFLSPSAAPPYPKSPGRPQPLASDGRC